MLTARACEAEAPFMTHLTDIPIVILAAGGSTRMGGRDKLMEPVDGLPLVRRQAELARAVTSGLVVVALPPPPQPRYDALEGLEVLCLPVMDSEEGMNASLRTAIAALPADVPAAMLILGDLPDLTRNDLGDVLDAMQTDALVWRGATAAGKPGHPIIFSAQLFDAFADLTGDEGGQHVMRLAKGRIRLVPLPGLRARNDLDTPEDWAKWRRDNPDRKDP
jgi:CTP:molybdopterin cytidylyltransferase MocA